MPVSVALDGPAGAGKSTIARLAASALGFIYADTGAFYRAVALAAIRGGVSSKNADDVKKLLESISVRPEFKPDGGQAVMLNGEDVSADIRTPEVSMAASEFSALPQVRAFLLDLQRSIAEECNVIMDGRDIGTVVLPNADVKIFLTASAQVRAQRRFKELAEKGMDVSYQEVYDDVVTRDYNDSHRETAPLKPADGCIMVDTTELDLEQSAEKIISVIKENI